MRLRIIALCLLVFTVITMIGKMSSADASGPAVVHFKAADMRAMTNRVFYPTQPHGWWQIMDINNIGEANWPFTSVYNATIVGTVPRHIYFRPQNVGHAWGPLFIHALGDLDIKPAQTVGIICEEQWWYPDTGYFTTALVDYRAAPGGINGGVSRLWVGMLYAAYLNYNRAAYQHLIPTCDSIGQAVAFTKPLSPSWILQATP